MSRLFIFPPKPESVQLNSLELRNLDKKISVTLPPRVIWRVEEDRVQWTGQIISRLPFIKKNHQVQSKSSFR
jgi:hypothetical protein